jgi:hypothetical protein
MEYLCPHEEELAGMEFFYASESVRLAQRYSNYLPEGWYWRDTSPCGHLFHARHQGRNILLRNLLGKYYHIYSVLYGSNRITLATVYADICLTLNFFGIYSGISLRDSLDRAEHFKWAMSATLDQIQSETEVRLCKIFDFVYSHSKEKHLLCMWFASESLHFAKLGGYTNPNWNITDPSVHLKWALSVRFDMVMRDIWDKYRLQFERLANKEPRSELFDFCAETSARLAAWGVECKPNNVELSTAPDDYRRQYVALDITGGVEEIWKQLESQVDHLTSALLLRERDIMII